MTETITTEELLHLALYHARKGQPDVAIGHLRKLIESDPEHSKAHYLLGALHAEIGMYDIAIQEMEQAVLYEPELLTAHFQLGMLHITSGDVASAESAWKALDKYDESEPLFLFKRGMLHLVKDEFESCVADLEKGIKLNAVNDDLNNDMRKIITRAQAAIGHLNETPKTPEENIKPSKRSSLSAYKKQDYSDIDET